MGLGAGETPVPQPGVQGLAPAFSRVELVLFFAARVDLVWPMGPSLFCWAPAKKGWLSGYFFLFLFSLSGSSASLFQLSYEVHLSMAVQMCVWLSSLRAAPGSRPV